MIQTPFQYGTFPVLLLWPFGKPQMARVKDDGGRYTEDLQQHDCFRNRIHVGGPSPWRDLYGNVEDYDTWECQVCGDIFEY